MPLKPFFCLTLLLIFSNCVVKKKTTYGSGPTNKVTVKSNGGKEHGNSYYKAGRHNKKADKVVAKAMTFSGTRYKYGGTSKKGMDCSGLIYVALQDNNIPFPRVSYQMANEGKKIALRDASKGDLLFFKTSKKGGRINHVGLVVDVRKDEIRFIHSTSSRGVIVSSLREGYWKSAFVKATRIL